MIPHFISLTAALVVKDVIYLVIRDMQSIKLKKNSQELRLLNIH